MCIEGFEFKMNGKCEEIVVIIEEKDVIKEVPVKEEVEVPVEVEVEGETPSVFDTENWKEIASVALFGLVLGGGGGVFISNVIAKLKGKNINHKP